MQESPDQTISETQASSSEVLEQIRRALQIYLHVCEFVSQRSLNMNQAFWTAERAAGGLLVGGLLVLMLAAVIMIASGAMPGFSAILQGSLAEVAPYAATFRLLILMFVVGWIIQLLGLSLLTRLLVRAGAEQIAILAFTLMVAAAVMAILWSTFRMSVELWAAQEAARTGIVPGLFEPMQAWTTSFEKVASRMHYVAMAGFGWGIVRTRLLTPALGWATIGWSALWLVGGLGGGLPPGLVFVMPAVIGVALLLG